MNKKYFFGLFLLVVGLIQCSTPVDRFTQLQDNVVAIHSTFESGYEEYGFGIVLGCSDGRLFIATAAHVVEQTGDSTLSNLVRFRGNDVDHPFKLIRSNKELDIALIEGTRPSSYQWIKNYEGSEVQSRQRVGYIGRNQEWYIPTEAVRGQINSIRDDRIIIDINGVSRGTSGAPLLNSSGIIGLIIEAEGAQARAIDWKRVKEELTGNGAYTVYLGDEGGKEVDNQTLSFRTDLLLGIGIAVLIIGWVLYTKRDFFRKRTFYDKISTEEASLSEKELKVEDSPTLTDPIEKAEDYHVDELNPVKLIIKSIVENRIEDAFSLLNGLNIRDSQISDSIILLQGRYHQWKRQKNNGTSSDEEIRIGLNKIRRALLETVKDIEGNLNDS